jgi:ketosteroid isomerase-like protein
MNDRAAIEAMLREAYAARVRALAGAADASPVAMRCTDCESLRGAMAGLIAAFEVKDHQILSLIVEGQQAAAHTRVRVRATASGEEVTTEMVDLITIRDGKIASFVEFVDTALAAKMLGG